MKRILLCTALCLAGVLAWGQTVVDSGTCGAEGDNLTWTLTDDGTLTISGTGEMADYTSYPYSPWYSYSDDIHVVVIKEGVTSIGESAFRGCIGLTSLVIPNGVTSIGNWAFRGCSGLTSVTIGEGVTSIGDWAFSGCSSLTVLNYNAVECEMSISTGWENISQLTIGDKVKVIPEDAFSDCSSLTSVVIPNNVASIGDRAFWYCSGLTSLTIGEGVTSIGSSAFYDCTQLTVLNFELQCG